MVILKHASKFLSGRMDFFNISNNFYVLTNIEKMDSCMVQHDILKETQIGDCFYPQYINKSTYVREVFYIFCLFDSIHIIYYVLIMKPP